MLQKEKDDEERVAAIKTACDENKTSSASSVNNDGAQKENRGGSEDAGQVKGLQSIPKTGGKDTGKGTL